MMKFYVTVRNSERIIGVKEFSETNLNAIKTRTTKSMKADGYTTVGSWGKRGEDATREFAKGDGETHLIISVENPATQKHVAKPQIATTEYERLIQAVDAQPACVYDYGNHHVGEYLNLFYETKRARIVRILHTRAGIRFLIRFQKGFSVMKPLHLQAAMQGARRKAAANARTAHFA